MTAATKKEGASKPRKEGLTIVEGAENPRKKGLPLLEGVATRSGEHPKIWNIFEEKKRITKTWC